jgi:cilia- and flagella-associated protein 57
VIIFKISEDAAGTMKLDKINEIQAHSNKIERMRLSFDNTRLFTVGKDGCLIIHEVKERDTKSKGVADKRGLEFSDEILTEKTEIDTY